MSSAISAKEIQAKQKELEMQPKIQIQELQKQSVILEDSNQITIENAKVVEEISFQFQSLFLRCQELELCSYRLFLQVRFFQEVWLLHLPPYP